jgi:uncharacterized protein YkwD
MKQVSVLLVSAFVAGVLAATGSVLDTPAADAAEVGSAAKESVQRCGGGRISLNADEARSLALHNRARENRRLSRLCVHPRLQRAARAHSKDMIERDYFSHDTKRRNESACERVRRYGYRFRYCAENIAYGSGAKGSPDSIMRRWMGSHGHRRNILSGKYREVGIGTHTGSFNGTRNVTMYTADFGRRP